jgi:hypothetical protein
VKLHGSNLKASMSQMGQKQTLKRVRPMSALPPIADIAERDLDVRFVPKADVLRCGEERRYSITSSAVASSLSGTAKPSALAVLRLMTSSNLVGCSTGNSAGLAPRKMRSTYAAARR